MTALPLAHVGHWAVNLLYFAPVVLIVAMLAVSSYRDKRAEAAEKRAGQTAGDTTDESPDR
ncbi:MAG: hypothetical protein ACR2LK_07745 [Solirubrobacteraceae bacterium]